MKETLHCQIVLTRFALPEERWSSLQTILQTEVSEGTKPSLMSMSMGLFGLFLNVNLCVKSFRSSRECTFLRKLFHKGWSGNIEAAGLIFQNIIISKLTLPLCVPLISTELALTESWLSFSSEQRWSIAASNNLISALQTMLSNLAWSVSTVWSLAWILLILVPDGVLDARVVL